MVTVSSERFEFVDKKDNLAKIICCELHNIIVISGMENIECISFRFWCMYCMQGEAKSLNSSARNNRPSDVLQKMMVTKISVDYIFITNARKKIMKG